MPRVPSSLLAAVVTTATLGLAACKPQPQSAADPRQSDRLVEVATVQTAPGIGRTYTGIVAARVQSNLGFRVQGKVIERLVDTGQIVRQGQPLMRIDPTDYVHAVTAQAGDVASARARWIQAAADERRYRGLIASGAESQSAYDQAKAAADSAKALLSAAEAQEQVAQNQNSYAVLLADADGTVVETLAEPGQVVTAGQIVIRLAHAGPREASVDLPETVRPAIGSIADASLYGATVHVPAHLRQLSDAADPRTRTFEARYVMDGVGAQAPLGATVTLTIGSTSAAIALTVPLGALDDEGKGPGVWVLDHKTSQVSYRPVEVSMLGSEAAEIAGGVQAGEQIVAMGGHYLHQAEHVRVADMKAAMQ
jgi:RND family efflux transporter MFP subunit